MVLREVFYVIPARKVIYAGPRTRGALHPDDGPSSMTRDVIYAVIRTCGHPSRRTRARARVLLRTRAVVWRASTNSDLILRSPSESEGVSKDGRTRHVWTAPSRQGLFRRFGKRIRCGHVSGLYARCMDRWPWGSTRSGSKIIYARSMRDDVCGVFRSGLW